MFLDMSGFNRVHRNLERLKDALDPESQTQLLVGAGEIVADRARELAPVDTGELRDSIAVRTSAPREMSFSIRSRGVRVFIGPGAEVWYAPYVEFGTWSREAQPYMRPAMDQTRDQVAAFLAKGLWYKITVSIRG